MAPFLISEILQMFRIFQRNINLHRIKIECDVQLRIIPAKVKYPATTILALLFIHVKAQNLFPEGLSDTITPESADVTFYRTLDSLPGDTIYTIEAPEGFVLRTQDYNATYRIALKTKSGYNVFNCCPAVITHWPVLIDTVNLNGRGNPELEIRWSYGNGRSGWASGWNESSSGILIWDLDKIELVFSFQDSFEYNFWWNGIEYDSSGNLATDSLGEVIIHDSLSGGESSCDKYDLKIELKQITIQRQADCTLNDTDSGAVLREDETIWIYELKRDELVLKNR